MPPVIDALASAPRLALVRALAGAPGSSGPELAAATHLHVNTVRAHLKELESAGLVEREAERGGGRGRPRLRYRLREGAIPGGDELLGLASLLGDALRRIEPKGEQIRRAGVEWGRRWSRHRSGEEPGRLVQAALERLGFAVRLEGGRLRLRACPCPLVAGEDPTLVCGLADAVADGALEGTTLRVTGRKHDPARRRCSLTLAAAG
jgi:predicted ArsR family transcriptional regulator